VIEGQLADFRGVRKINLLLEQSKLLDSCSQIQNQMDKALPKYGKGAHPIGQLLTNQIFHTFTCPGVLFVMVKTAGR
jgi:hypothetical protein